MDDGGQQLFVAQHDGRPSAVLVAFLVAQPVADIACLDMFGGSSEVGKLLGLLEVLVDVVTLAVELVGEVFEVGGNVAACLVVVHVVVVEVPVEAGLVLLLQC